MLKTYLNLGSLVSIGDGMNVFWRSFLNCLKDHGGDFMHLRRLLENTMCDRSLLNAFAKKIVGPIWDLADNAPSLLDTIDFECPFEQFRAQHPNIQILPGAVEKHDWRWSGKPPHRLCRYKLTHFDRPMLFHEIEKAELGTNTEHAGFRELIAYASTMKASEFCHCDILAAGSRRMKVEQGQATIDHSSFILPHASASDDGIRVGWRGVKRPDEDRFGTECFYLVRVYS